MNFGKILGKHQKEANIEGVGVGPPRLIKFYSFIVEVNYYLYTKIGWGGGG